MTTTCKAPRLPKTAKTSADVTTMLHDIATVLRLTAMVKHEMLRDRAEADHRQLLANRSARAAALEPATA
jgi:hypothetical protein